MITKISDYKGYFALAKNLYTNEHLQDYIDRFEESALRDLLQCEYDAFVADLVDGVPQSAKWLDIYNSFYECSSNGATYQSKGIPDYLKCMVFYNYSLEGNISNTITGTVKQRGSASDVVGNQFTRNYRVYNQGVRSFNGIMCKMVDSAEVYDLNFKTLNIITPFT